MTRILRDFFDGLLRAPTIAEVEAAEWQRLAEAMIPLRDALREIESRRIHATSRDQ